VTVPLSEREQKILEEIERDLYREDPRFARGVHKSRKGLSQTARARLGGALFVAGVCSLLAFFAKQWLVFGVVAFGAMVAGVVLIAGALRSLASDDSPLRERLSSRWRRWEERFRERYRNGR
jgi:hypothetical protein